MMKYIMKVVRSCKTYEQRWNCKLWIDRIVKDVEFAEICYKELGFRYE